ncbi:MAG: hypothetical protein V4757_07365 [Pseudomonadota bacterium]
MAAVLTLQQPPAGSVHLALDDSMLYHSAGWYFLSRTDLEPRYLGNEDMRDHGNLVEVSA